MWGRRHARGWARGCGWCTLCGHLASGPLSSGLSSQGPEAPSGRCCSPSQERAVSPCLPKDGFSRCQEEGLPGTDRLGTGGPLSVRPALAGAELRQSSQSRPQSSAGGSCCPEPLTALLIFVPVLHVKRLRPWSCPSPPASQHWSRTLSPATRDQPTLPAGLYDTLPVPGCKPSFFLSAHAALWGVADILNVNPVSVWVCGLCCLQSWAA